MTANDRNILWLDLSTRTGFAIGRPTETPRSGSIKFGKDQSSPGQRYRYYRQWLERIISQENIDLVGMESPQPPSFHMGTTQMRTLRLLIGLAEHTEEFCLDRVELREASVSDIRNHFIGRNPRGKIGKLETQRKCTQLGWEWEDDNAADALAGWHYMCSILRPELALRTTPLFQTAVPHD